MSKSVLVSSWWQDEHLQNWQLDNFASLVCMNEVPWDMSLPGLGIGITVDAFQTAHIRQSC